MAACPPPGGGTPPAATYTTTVSGKVTTPAGNTVTQYETAARPSVPSVADAKVWASTASATKVPVAADGSYTLEVTDHPGTFTLNVDYPAARDYKAGAPQSVTTTATAHTQNIALSYGYTTTMSGLVTDCLSVTSCSNRNGATVIIIVESTTVEDPPGSGVEVVVGGVEVARTTSRTIGGNEGSYRITFDHPGTFRATASFQSRKDAGSYARHTDPTLTGTPANRIMF